MLSLPAWGGKFQGSTVFSEVFIMAPGSAPSALLSVSFSQKKRSVALAFEDGKTFNLPCEYLRISSPSAENQDPRGGSVVFGKKEVNLTAIEPVGHYALRLIFDDGHSTGLYTFEYLYTLGIEYPKRFESYLHALERLGLSRNPCDAKESL